MEQEIDACFDVLTPVTEPRTFRTNPGHLQLEAEVEDTKL